MRNDEIRILIAEDEMITAMDFINTLLGLGYHVSAVVASGEDLIKEINSNTHRLSFHFSMSGLIRLVHISC